MPLTLLTLLFFLQGPLLFGQGIAGRVVGVTDGDTVTVLDDRNVQHKIRLAGIDAPELSQGFGSFSRQSLSNLVFGKRVQVIGDKSDKYGRTNTETRLLRRVPAFLSTQHHHKPAALSD
jgi:endonuclease YncB( thermonuclease family)